MYRFHLCTLQLKISSVHRQAISFFLGHYIYITGYIFCCRCHPVLDTGSIENKKEQRKKSLLFLLTILNCSLFFNLFEIEYIINLYNKGFIMSKKVCKKNMAIMAKVSIQKV